MKSPGHKKKGQHDCCPYHYHVHTQGRKSMDTSRIAKRQALRKKWMEERSDVERLEMCWDLMLTIPPRLVPALKYMVEQINEH